MEIKTIIVVILAPILGALGIGFFVAGYMGYLSEDVTKFRRFFDGPWHIDEEFHRRWPVFCIVGLILLLITYLLATS